MKVNRTRRVKDMYMRGTLKVNKYIQKIDELNAYITIKEMEEVEEKNYLHINGNEVCNMDKGCAVIEYTPLDDNYNVRAFMNNNYEIVLYYIDMTLRNYKKDGEAYYEDLFLDLYLAYQNGDANTWLDERTLPELNILRKAIQNDSSFESVFPDLSTVISNKIK